MTLQFQTYSRILAKTNEENMFLFFVPWGGLVLQNCDELGDLLHFHGVLLITGKVVTPLADSFFW
jgi:hypothetical protein